MKTKILIVGDEFEEEMNFESIITSLGFDVVGIASTGEDALQKIADLRPDLVLIDIILKGKMGGIKAAAKIKDDFNIPVVYIADHPEESAFSHAKITTPHGYLINPVSKTDLKNTIELALYKHQMELRLKESEEKYRQFFNDDIRGGFFASPEGKLIECNPSFAKICGFNSPEEVVGTDISIFNPDDWINLVNQLRTDGNVLNHQVVHIKPDGNKINIVANLSGVFNKLGELSEVKGNVCDYTERKKVEEMLHKERQQLFDILETMHVMVCILAPDYRVIFANRSFREAFGDCIGKRCYDACFGKDEPCDFCESFTPLKTNKPHNWLVNYSEDMVLDVFDYPFKDIDGSPLILEIDIDITPHKKAEQKIHDQYQTLKGFINSFESPMFSVDTQYQYTSFNKSHAALMKAIYSAKIEIGKSLLEYQTVAEDRLLAKANLDRALEGEFFREEAFSGEHSRSYFEVYHNPIWDGNRNVMGVAVSAQDITERKKAENTLKESEAYYRTIFTHTGAANVIIEEDATISLANPEFEKLSGYSADEIEGKLRWTNFVREDDLERVRGYHIQRRINPELVPEKYELHFVNRHAEVKNILLFVALIPGTKKSIASLLNITEQKRVNDYLRWELNVNEALNKIYAPLVSAKSTIEEIANLILNQTFELTDSKYGYIGEIKPYTHDMMLLSMMPPMPLNEPQKPILKLEEDGIYDGLMGHSLNIKKGFFTNDPASHLSYGEQDGHLQIKKFLSVPVILKNELVGQISVANSNRDYTENDLDAVNRLSHFYSLALQKIRDREEIQKSLAEKEVLLREIHHRVKNNMQIISSLLNLQIQYEDLDGTAGVLKESQGRVKSMAMVHEKLYQSDSFSKINFKDYITNLLSEIFYSYGIERGSIGWELDVEDINIGIDTVIPLGLIVNELVTNSVKYAFPQGEGTITINLKSLSEQIKLNITDDGIGLPKNIDIENTKTLGLQLVNSLVNQIDGNIEMDRSHGTGFKITFKELEYKERI